MLFKMADEIPEKSRGIRILKCFAAICVAHERNTNAQPRIITQTLECDTPTRKCQDDINILNTDLAASTL